MSRRLSEKFSAKCFNGVELYSLKDNFQSLAEHSDSEGEPSYLFWSEDTLIRFLSLPASLDVGSIIFAASGYIGALPITSPDRVPAILDYAAMLRVVSVFTGRYKNTTKRRHDPLKLLFRSFAVYDRGPPSGGETLSRQDNKRPNNEKLYSSDGGSEDDNDDDDDFSLAALEALDDLEVFGHQERPNTSHARIPTKTMRHLIALLLVLSPLQNNEPIATHVDRFTGDSLNGLWKKADTVLASFIRDGTKNDISYHRFKTVIRRSLVPRTLRLCEQMNRLTGNAAISIPRARAFVDPTFIQQENRFI